MAHDVVADDIIVVVDGHEARGCVTCWVYVEPTVLWRDAISFAEPFEKAIVAPTILSFSLGEDGLISPLNYCLLDVFWHQLLSHVGGSLGWAWLGKHWD